METPAARMVRGEDPIRRHVQRALRERMTDNRPHTEILTVPKRALGTRAPMTLPQGPNQRWSLDFLSDAFADGRRFRILAIVDDFTRECLALVPDTSLPGLRVVRELDASLQFAAVPRCASPTTAPN